MSKKKSKEKTTAREEGQEQGIKLDLHKTAKIALICLSTLLFIYDVFYLLPDANPTTVERIKTILLFVVMSYGIGYTIIGFVNHGRSPGREKPEDPFEKHFMTLGVGLSMIPILTLILSTFDIPLDATLLLVISLIYPAYSMLIKRQKIGLDKYTLTNLLENKNALTAMIVVMLASLYLFVLLKGALTLPYLEDDDSWDHAIGAKYISVVKDYSLPEGVPVTHYLEPYPPTYDGLMGILHQYNSSVQWTLKFFNALLIGISIITAYYFIRLFTGDEKIALGGAFILTVVPCYLSHFIWAHTLGHVLFYPTLYAVEMSNRDRKWALPAILAIASVTVTQPMISLVFGLFYVLYYITRVIFERKLLKQFFAIGILGLLLAVVFFWGQMVLKYGTGFEKIDRAGKRIQSGEFKIAFEERVMPFEEVILLQSFQDKQPDNCAALIPGRYCIPLSGNIAIQKGFGVVLFLLFIISLILLVVYFKREVQGNAYWVPVSLVWGIFTLIGLESWMLPVSVDPPRFFMFMTLPMAILVPKGVLILTDLLKSYVKPEHVMMVLFIAVLYTSAYPKYVVQTAIWPYGVMWNGPEQVQGYVALKSALPPDAKVFPMCMADNAVIGLDKLSYAWDGDVLDYREKILDRTPSEIYEFLKKKGYEYAILDVACIVRCNKDGTEMNSCMEKINKMADDISKSGLYAQAWSNKAVIVYKIK